MSELALAGVARRGVTHTATTPRAPARHPLAADVLVGAEAYQDLRDEWHRLAELQSTAVLFQMPEMLAAWARHVVPGGRARSLATVVVRHEARVVLIWPLLVTRRGPFRIASGAGSPIGQYDEVLLDPDYDGETALSEALAALSRSVGPDLIFLERVRADSALRAALPNAAPLSWAEGAPYTDLSDGMDSVRATRKPRVLRQQKKRVRTFAQSGKVEFNIAASPDEAKAWLGEALALKRDWLCQTGRVSRAFMTPSTSECLMELARALCVADASLRMVVSRLALDGRTAAIEVGFRHRGSYHLYIGAFQPEFAKLGPGNVLTEKMLEWCVANGVNRYDMLAPRSRNKREWQSNEVAIVDFAFPLTFSGRLYAELVMKRAEPMLRDLFYVLPPRVRSFVARTALRM